MKGQHAPTTSPGLFGKQAVRSVPVQTASTSTNFSAGTSDEPQQQRADDGDQDVGRRIEQTRAQEADEAGGLHRRGPLGHEILADEKDEVVSLIRPCSG